MYTRELLTTGKGLVFLVIWFFNCKNIKGLPCDWCCKVYLPLPDTVFYLDLAPMENSVYSTNERYEEYEFQKRVYQNYEEMKNFRWKVRRFIYKVTLYTSNLRFLMRANRSMNYLIVFNRKHWKLSKKLKKKTLAHSWALPLRIVEYIM